MDGLKPPDRRYDLPVNLIIAAGISQADTDQGPAASRYSRAARPGAGAIHHYHRC